MLVEKLKPYPCSENCQYRIHPQCDSFHKYHIFTADVPLIRVGILEVELLPDGRVVEVRELNHPVGERDSKQLGPMTGRILLLTGDFEGRIPEVGKQSYVIIADEIGNRWRVTSDVVTESTRILS